VRGVIPPRRRATQAGISLVETLVALVLGLVMVSVAFNLYMSNRSVFRQIEGMVRLQESASIATALLENDIRHAAGTLCRNSPPTTSLLDAQNSSVPGRFWETATSSNRVNFLGLHGYESITPDPIVKDKRLAGDSISLMSDNMGKIARVTAPATHTSASGTGGLTGSYTFTVDDGTKFPVGTVAMACDYARAVLFQVTASDFSKITLNTGSSLSPGNCAVTMKRGKLPGQPVAAMEENYSCYGGQGMNPQFGKMYTFGPGSSVAEHTFHHWYIGRKTNTEDGLSLYRVSMGYDAAGNVKLDAAEEMVQDVTDMQIEYLPSYLYAGYPTEYFYKPANSMDGTPAIMGMDFYTYRSVTAVRIVLTLTSPDKIGLGVGQGASNAATAATYTIPINVAIRARMPGVVRR